MPPATAVIGVGNRFRGDDGVGPAVVDALSGESLGDVVVVECDGEVARLIDGWSAFDTVVLVDAARSDRPVGSVAVLSGEEIRAPVSAVSTHGAGVVPALELARALGRLPRRVVVVAVEGECFQPGEGLSPAVEACVPEAVTAVRAELDRLDGR